MAEGKNKRIKSTILLSAALVAALAVSGCQIAREDEASGANEKQNDTMQQAPSASQAPSAHTTSEPSPTTYDDQVLVEAISAKVREYYKVPLENEYAAIFNKLEVETLIIMAVAADKRLLNVDEESYPSFEELKPELLKYNSVQALEPWAYVYENATGWLQEPYDLLYTHRMVESSLTVTEREADQIKIAFKVYGNQKETTPSSKIMTVTMLQDDGSWKVDSIRSEAVAHAFSKEEVDGILAKVLADAEYQGQDDTHYYYTAEQIDYVFDKENGYYALAMDAVNESETT